MLIFTLFLPPEGSRVELVIRLLDCRQPDKVFALLALHTFAAAPVHGLMVQ
jgi:hypothetical protein